jgi:hypothetical protein
MMSLAKGYHPGEHIVLRCPNIEPGVINSVRFRGCSEPTIVKGGFAAD